jgi:hypothetical protein
LRTYVPYCNPGSHFDQCWAEKWGCPIQLIAELKVMYPLNGDPEHDYRATVAFINDLKARGYTKTHKYCIKCRSRNT